MRWFFDTPGSPAKGFFKNPEWKWSVYQTPTELINTEKFGAGLTQIAKIKTCKSLKHNPPSHLVMEPGVYVWKCEACGEAFQFVVSEIYW